MSAATSTGPERLSANFTLAEFTRSQTAARNGWDNSVPAALMDHARATAEMLERIRSYLSERAGRTVPIQITSGYRSLPVNRAVGSRDTSDHVQAMAADILAPSFGTPLQICQALAPVIDTLGIGQLINEFPPTGWVHVSIYQPAREVNRIITINRRGTFAGIVEG